MNQLLEYLFPLKTKAQVIKAPISAPAYVMPGGPASAQGMSVTGYYTDLSAEPIGNRPVYSSYSQYIYPTSRINLKNGKFNCVQPVWGEDCH